jgi:polyisoprenoid-binding protein YceI
LYELGPTNGSLTVRTGRVGVASAAGHDLLIEVQRWRASLDLVRDEPERSRLQATVDATSLRVREGTGGVKPLTDSDRAKIQGDIAKTLKTDRYPEITFESTAIYGLDRPEWQISGRLTIAGAREVVQIPVRAEPNGSETLLKASVQIVQTAFGIKPYTGFLGALKVADAVQVSVEARIDPTAAASS